MCMKIHQRVANSICVLTPTLTIIFVPLFQVSPLHAYFSRWFRVHSPTPISADLSEFIKKKKKDSRSLILSIFFATGTKNYGSKAVGAFTKFYRTIMHAN